MYTDLCVSMPFKFHINHANLIDFIRGPPARAAAKRISYVVVPSSSATVPMRATERRHVSAGGSVARLRDRCPHSTTGHPSEAHLRSESVSRPFTPRSSPKRGRHRTRPGGSARGSQIARLPSVSSRPSAARVALVLTSARGTSPRHAIFRVPRRPTHTDHAHRS